VNEQGWITHLEGHEFHRGCLAPWVLQHLPAQAPCPSCRAPINAASVIPPENIRCIQGKSYLKEAGVIVASSAAIGYLAKKLDSPLVHFVGVGLFGFAEGLSVQRSRATTTVSGLSAMVGGAAPILAALMAITAFATAKSGVEKPWAAAGGIISYIDFIDKYAKKVEMSVEEGFGNLAALGLVMASAYGLGKVASYCLGQENRARQELQLVELD